MREGVRSGDGGVDQGDWEGEVYGHLLCLQGIQLQVVEAAPGHQAVYLPPVGRLVTIRDESYEGGVIHKLQ